MNDARLEPLPWAANFVQLKIPLFWKVSDLPRAGDIDPGLVNPAGIVLLGKSHRRGGQPFVAPDH
jgi:hypothetical protein